MIDAGNERVLEDFIDITFNTPGEGVDWSPDEVMLGLRSDDMDTS